MADILSLHKISQRIPRNFEAQLEVNPKLGIKHVIDTKEEAPTRPLLPGSEKEVKGKKPWKELEELGIVIKVL